MSERSVDPAAAEPAPEFSRPQPIDRIGGGRQETRLTASAAECAALATRYDILAVKALSALVGVRRVRSGHYVAVDLQIDAQVVQACVVTLEPVAQTVHEECDLLFGPIGRAPAHANEIVLDDLDQAEPLDGPELDLGELVTQHLSLALDPYPRAPDASLADVAPDLVIEGEDAEPEPRPSPFAKLASLTPRKPDR